MDSFSKKILNKKGAALITVYMVVAVLLAFGGFVVDVSNSQNSAANTFKKQAQAIGIAEAGLDRALVWLRTQGTPPTGTIASISQNLPPTGTPIGSYTVAFTDLGSPGGSASIRRYRIRSTGTIGSTSQTVTNYLQTDNYARYIWFTDSESYQGTNVWFWDEDHLNGPTHTNGHFNIKGNPLFEGEVRSVDNYIRYYNNGSNINSSSLSNAPYDVPDFRDTVTLGSDSINMPTQALNLRAASTNGGLRLTGNSTVLLKADGTMNVTNAAKGWTNRNMALPANGALFVSRGNLNISGTLKGRLTVGSSADINVTGSILYADDPRVTGSTSTDTLGIISEGDVMISKTAGYDVEIDASIMALNTSFMLDEWWTNGAKGTLSVFGGIIQKQRGPVGTFSGATKISGYSKDYNYDVRLLSSPPPFVPTTDDYITLSWEN
ncbi:MAG TPA: DUF4900 domain-containing protein [Candidatus Omnitrophota bacterium]|nr:DUF4900 domain-containing protein [Candidatus Omnitrophota bacterium]HPT39573.1 DUF4900 domain-containing protein [Candidatus Omnitrophota bacterium]